MSGPLTPIAQGLFAALRPLGSAIEEPADLSLLLRSLGWEATVTSEVVTAMPWTSELAAILDEGEALLGQDGDTTLRLLDLIRRVVELIEGIQADPPAGAGVPELLRDPAFWEELALDLPEYLLLRYLERDHGLVFGALRLLGLIEQTSVPAAGDRAAFERQRLAWTSLPDVLADPGAHLASLPGDELVPALQRFFRGIGFRTRTRPVEGSAGTSDLAIPLLGGVLPERGYVEAGAVVVPQAGASGVLVTNLTWGEPDGPVALDPTWTLEVTGSPPATGALGVLITGDGALPQGTPAPDLGLSLTGAPEQPWRPVGGDSGPRLELSAATAVVTLRNSDQPELAVEVVAPLVLRVAPGDGDSFLAGVLGALQLDAPVELALRASSATGVTFGGSVGLAVTIALELAIGPVQLTQLGLAVRAEADGGTTTAALEAALSAAAVLGPFAVTVEGIGVAAELERPASESALARLGDLGLGVRFLPPSAVGFSVEAPLTSGGGRIAVYPEIGRYEGALAIDIAAVGIQAMVVIDTAVAGEPDGWTFFASLTARFPGVPLGFGFTLTGAGGLIALNRCVDGEALALGLRDGAANALLFPDDPVRDSAVLFGQLDEYFPAAAGNTVIGPVIEVGWGAPTIITGQLGVLISLPQGVITILGSLTANLPTPDAPILELHMDALGVVDVPGGTVLVAASLYDSRLLGFIELSGDVAAYVSVIEDPYFLLSVGGYHPGFRPPAHVPTALEALRRIRADIDVGEGVSAAITSYFAVTSNSVQFGGGFELEASAAFAGVTYSARGWFDFDVLFQFNPFILIADVSAGVGVYAGSKELLGVELSAHLEGPEPWFATAAGRFRFFFVNVKFDVTVGEHAAPAIPDTVDVLATMAAELAHPEAWSARRPTSPAAGLLLRHDVPETLVRPDDSVVVRQSVAPLGETLERFGELTPLQDEVHVTSTTVVDGATGEPLSDLTVEDVDGWFAPAQFEAMRDEARLSAPSYELHPAGVAFGAAGVAVPDDEIAVPAGHETDVWEPETGLRKELGIVVAAAPLDVVLASSVTSRAATAWRGARADIEPVSVTPTGYVLVDAASGMPAPEGAAATRIVPSHATAVAA